MHNEPTLSSSPSKAEAASTCASVDLALAVSGCFVWTMAGTALRLLFAPWFGAMGFLSPQLTYFGYNAAGSFVMGAAAAMMDPVAHFALFRWITTGFCGAFTSLSMWIVTSCLITSRNEASSSVVQIICGMTVPLVFYQWGLDGGSWLVEAHRRLIPPLVGQLGPAESTRNVWRDREKGMLVTSWVALGILLLSLPLTSSVSLPSLYAVIFSPIGGITRLALGHNLNGRHEWRKFPVGTLVANMIAVAVATAVVTRVSNSEWSTIVISGFCGALSTVSSWVHEIHQLMRADRPLAYVYALTTVGVCCAIAALGRAS